MASSVSSTEASGGAERQGIDMPKLPKQVADFLGHQRIAIAGVSRDSAQPANTVYRKLRGLGYRVFAVNPKAAQVEGDPCYPDLRSIPDGVEAVVIATHPQVAAQVVRECSALGVRHIWFHRSFGQGSMAEEAIQECEQRGITVWLEAVR